MFHSRRTWRVTKVETPLELAQKLKQHTWCLCAGFVVSGHPDYLFLNDSTSEDALVEFGAVKGGLEARERVQVESIRRALAGGYDEQAWSVPDPDKLPRTSERLSLFMYYIGLETQNYSPLSHYQYIDVIRYGKELTSCYLDP